mgnify:CR=1 FL=1
MHQHLIGGGAANAAFYAPELITKILRGMGDTADAGFADHEGHDMDVSMAKAAALHDIPATSILRRHIARLI